MDIAQILVTAGGVGLIGFTLWFFFGKGAQPQKASKDLKEQ
jgi:plastocyanin domain-containing protein